MTDEYERMKAQKEAIEKREFEKIFGQLKIELDAAYKAVSELADELDKYSAVDLNHVAIRHAAIIAKARERK
jgi:hypothetical protein